MKHLFKILVPFLLAVLLFCACGKRDYQPAIAYDDYQSTTTYFESPSAGVTQIRWEGTGYSLQDSAAIEASMAPAFRDMSNLYGETAASSEALFENDLHIRKLVKRAELRVRVDELEAVEAPLEQLLEKYGAWLASSRMYENSHNYSIRVPSGAYDKMLVDLSGIGKIIRRNESTEDVTLRYYDLESRLDTKRELLKTYQGYLEKAKNIDEIMTVESRIADLQREIDQTGTQFRNLANLVDYSTISLEFVGPVTASSYYEPGIGEKLAGLFGSFGKVASTGLVIILGIIIYGIPIALILLLFFWLLFGRIGLLKRLIMLAAGKRN